MKIIWEKCYSGKSSTTYQCRLSTGSIWFKSIDWTGSIDIERYPTETYFERNMLDENNGSKIRSWAINH